MNVTHNSFSARLKLSQLLIAGVSAIIRGGSRSYGWGRGADAEALKRGPGTEPMVGGRGVRGQAAQNGSGGGAGHIFII